MDATFLEKLGLTKNESDVYLTLLKIGKTSINAIAEDIGLHRRTIYDCLVRLEQKGLVTHLKDNGTKIFYAQNPEKLNSFLNEREEEVKKQKDELKMHISFLNALFKQSSNPPNVYIYKGVSGIKQIFKEILEVKPKEYYAFGSTSNVRNVMPDFLDITYSKFQKMGIKIKAVIVNTPDRIKRAKELNKSGFHEIRIMNSDLESPLTTYIIENKTIFMVWSDPNPYAIVLDDKNISIGFKNYFISLWNSSKKP